MKKILFGLIMSFLLIAPFGQVAKAYYPTLSASWEGGNIRIVISNAQPNARVDVYYRTQDSQVWNVTSGLGTTDWSGNFTNYANLGIGSGNNTSLYAMVGSDQTTTVNLGSGSSCWGGSCGYGNITFSQNNVSLSTGQSQSISIYSTNSYYSGSYYVSSNSNSSAVSATISGSILNLYGQSSGSASISVCQNSGIYYAGGYNNCGTIYVTVGGGVVGGLTFSNANPSLSVGQSQSVTVSVPYFHSGNFYISNNTNSVAISATISGSTINLYGNSAGSGTITVCLSGSSSACGSLYVTVSGSSYGNITFSQNNVSLTVGQSQSVIVYNSGSSYYGYGNYTVSSSNPNVVSATISGSSLSLYGLSAGSSTIMVCQSGYYSGCGNLYATVSGGNTSFYLSPSSVSLNPGQTSSVTANFSYVYSGYLYLGSNSNANVATVSFSGSTVNVYGVNPGSTTMSICYSGQCNNLYVTVTGNACYGYNCNSNLYFTTTNLPQPTVNQYYSYQLQASGGSGSYTYYLNSGSLPAGLSLSTSGQLYGTPISTSPASFAIRVNDSYNRSAVASLTLTPSGGSVLGTTLYANGTLIRDNGTVYIVYKNTKTGFSNASAFRGLGFSFSQVSYVSTSGLSDSGYVVSTASASHPWGSWVKSGRVVYFVHEEGLIPVPSAETFLNNGGVWGLVVNANTYDFARPILPAMEYNDSRLR